MGYNGFAVKMVKGLSVLGMCAALFGQTASFHEDTLHGRTQVVSFRPPQ